jgi:hypothetical protein
MSLLINEGLFGLPDPLVNFPQFKLFYSNPENLIKYDASYGKEVTRPQAI